MIKSHNEDRKQSKSRFFLLICFNMEGSGSVPLTADPYPRGPKTYGSYGSGSGPIESDTICFDMQMTM